MLRSFCPGAIAKNLTKHGLRLPATIPALVADAQTAQKVKLARDAGREEREPLAQDTWAPVPWRYTPHEANLFVDKELDIDRSEFRVFRQFRKDSLAASTLAGPLFFGAAGFLPFVLQNANEHWLPTALTRQEGESHDDQMIRRYAEHTDLKRLKYGPQVHRLTLTLGSIQKGGVPAELVPAYRNLFWNQVDNESMERDVTLLPEFARWADGDLNLHGGDGRNFSYMEWYRHALDFTGEVWQFGTPFVFGPWSWNFEDYKQRLLNWYEDILQDSQLIKKQGGLEKLSDKQLLLAALDRGIARVEENLSRAELTKRMDEWFYLEDSKVEIPWMLAWAGGYHYDHILDLDPFLESSHLWEEGPSRLPAAQPDVDPFASMHLRFNITADQERIIETYREIWAKTRDDAERNALFGALAALVSDGAPAYVANLRPEVMRNVVTHVTTNLLQRGNGATSQESESGEWTLSNTLEFELRDLIAEREDRVLPKACNSSGYHSERSSPSLEKLNWPVYHAQDPATTFEAPQMKLAWLPARTHQKDAMTTTKVAV